MQSMNFWINIAFYRSYFFFEHFYFQATLEINR